MQTFIVRVGDGAGNFRWVTVLGTSAKDVRSRVVQGAPGWTAQEVFQDFEDAQSTDSTLEGKSINDIRYFGSLPPAEAGGAGDMGGGGGGAGGAGGQTPPGPILGSEDFGLLPAFEAGLSDRGMGFGVGSGVAGQLAGQEFGNLQSRGLLDAAFFAPPGQIDTSQFADADRPTAAELNKFQGTTFQDYVKNAALFGGGATADANRLFSEALRLSQGRTPGFTQVVGPDGFERNRFDVPGEPGVRGLPTPIAGAFLNPQQGAAGSEDLARAARQAGRSRFGFASKFLPSAERLTNSFFAQPQQGAQTFADFLSNKIFGV